jgi:hypothetical protein
MRKSFQFVFIYLSRLTKNLIDQECKLFCKVGHKATEPAGLTGRPPKQATINELTPPGENFYTKTGEIFPINVPEMGSMPLDPEEGGDISTWPEPPSPPQK